MAWRKSGRLRSGIDYKITRVVYPRIGAKEVLLYRRESLAREGAKTHAERMRDYWARHDGAAKTEQAARMRAYWLNGCSVTVPASELDGDEPAGAQVVLLMLTAAARHVGVCKTVVTKWASFCPHLGAPLKAVRWKGCRYFRKSDLDTIKELREKEPRPVGKSAKGNKPRRVIKRHAESKHQTWLRWSLEKHLSAGQIAEKWTDLYPDDPASRGTVKQALRRQRLGTNSGAAVGTN
ncbi:MAG: hypothetical protein L0Y72_14155 [Gemmataceae bacterium]|nr:hypothetical protein [Gemmataceae bacterium]MCI0740185.1 hypothetical protein [Gemmataceae bacterium]